MLEAIIHPILGKSLLDNLGMKKTEEQLKLVNEIRKIKSTCIE